ncbi:MAG: hypothetical protein EZS28_010846 [Streblomastix strix]|uniref:Rho-GAP domain-containing protein n=1 Tax=Streblomastix strix TaxID=222440 RepID=A0A5J4WFX6_9EUKA|nr:MAG: hypothetical protein EZS28_010846 [Streblomastix strix]
MLVFVLLVGMNHPRNEGKQFGLCLEDHILSQSTQSIQQKNKERSNSASGATSAAIADNKQDKDDKVNVSLSQQSQTVKSYQAINTHFGKQKLFEMFFENQKPKTIGNAMPENRKLMKKQGLTKDLIGKILTYYDSMEMCKFFSLPTSGQLKEEIEKISKSLDNSSPAQVYDEGNNTLRTIEKLKQKENINDGSNNKDVDKQNKKKKELAKEWWLQGNPSAVTYYTIDPSLIAGLIKMWIVKLNEPIIPFSLHSSVVSEMEKKILSAQTNKQQPQQLQQQNSPDLLNANRKPFNLQQESAEVCIDAGTAVCEFMTKSLPLIHFYTLKYLIRFIRKICHTTSPSQFRINVDNMASTLNPLVFPPQPHNMNEQSTGNTTSQPPGNAIFAAMRVAKQCKLVLVHLILFLAISPDEEERFSAIDTSVCEELGYAAALGEQDREN